MDSNAVYIDEHGNRVDPNAVGSTHDIIGEQDPETGMIKPTSPIPTTPLIDRSKAQEERVSSFMDVTSPTRSLKNIDNILRGRFFDNEVGEYVQVADPLPEKIRKDFLQFMTPDLSEDARMTNLSTDNINGIMISTIEWCIDYLDIVADDEGLEEEQMSKIFWVIIKAVFYTITRSQAGMERSLIFRSLTMGEQANPNQAMMQQQKESWWKFWK